MTVEFEKKRDDCSMNNKKIITLFMKKYTILTYLNH